MFLQLAGIKRYEMSLRQISSEGTSCFSFYDPAIKKVVEIIYIYI